MYRIILLFLLAFNCAFAQDLSELEKRNGFKDIKLGISVDSIQGAKLKKEFKEKDEFPAKLFEVENPAYEKIGEVSVKSVELKTYKNLIYEIYFWRTSTLTLKFGSHGKHHLELTYTSFPIHKMMKEDKGKKVEDIAEDF